ncbi:MAG: hypothetical protein ACXAC7_13895 [Candidatus Hodarchaeales archaeon]|jgi:hypothetical protein
MPRESSNNKFLGLIAVMFFAAVGFILSKFLTDVMVDLQSSATGLVLDIVDFLSTPGMWAGIVWLVICIVVYFGVGFAFPDGESIGPFSPLLFLLWIFTNVGLIIGYILWFLIDGQTITIDLDFLVDAIFLNLVFSLAPTFAASLGIVNKLDRR